MKWVLGQAEVLEGRQERQRSWVDVGQAEALEWTLVKAGCRGCRQANLASTKTSFRAAKPLPSMRLGELRRSGVSEGRQAEALGHSVSPRLSVAGLGMAGGHTLAAGHLGCKGAWLALQGEGWRGGGCLA